MRRAAFVVLLTLLAPVAARAGSYIPQATFNGPASTLAGMDRDAVGNLYLLGRAQGSVTYQVTGETTQGITPLFSFDTGLSMPVAFAVEGSGVIDILDGANGYTLKRYTNPGTFVDSATFFVTYATPNMIAAAIDKTNARVYIAYQYTYHPIYLQCLGCGGPSSITKTTINQYDFQGNLLKAFSMPGTDAAPGSCYTPTAMAADPQGNVYIADGLCQQVVKFSPAGSVTSLTPASQWTYSFGPRGMWTDATSNLYISEAVCGPTGCPQGVVKLGSDVSFQTSFVADSAVGCAWDSRILYLSSSGSQPLRRFVFDGAPSVPIESAPFGMVVQHSSAAALSWQASSDPDGDPVTYTAYLGSNPTQLSAAGTASQPEFAMQPLTFGGTYYWQVVAQDSYLGLPLQQTPAPVESFNLNLTNQPPGAFTVVSGSGTAVTRATSVTLAWQAAVDPDGDSVVYDVLWGTSPQGAALLGTTAATNWPVSGLGFGTTYYWTVRARDVYNATTQLAGGTQTYSQVFLDSPPPAPTILAGSGSLGEHTLTPSATLSWSSVANAQGDPIRYRLYWGTSADALGLVQDSTATTDALAGLQFGTTYYWAVAAYDPYGGASTTPVQGLALFLQDTPPLPFAVLTGTGTLATRGTSQLLSWAPAVDPEGDPVAYELDLSTSPVWLPAVQTSTATSFTLTFQLGTTYYWQVAAHDSFGGVTYSGLQTFHPVFLNHPPTVPANQSKTGTVPYHGFSPSQSFFWGPSTDPDGDPFTYTLAYGTDSARMAVISSTTLGLSLPVPLNTAFYYSVVATDIYGAASASPVNWVYYQFANNPPGGFDVIGTTGSIAARQTSTTLSWTASVDPDGDPVSYGVFLGTAASSLSLLTATTKTAAPLGTLSFGTTYYWRVDAYDGFGGTTTANEGTQSLAYTFYDPPPSAIVYLSTAAAYSEHASSPSVALSWTPSTNAAGDPISYAFELQTSTSVWPPVSMGPATSLTLPVVFETTYTWRADASDPYGATSTGTWMSFVVHLANQPPYPVEYLTPASVSTRAASYPITWGNSGDPDGDPVSYRLDAGSVPAQLAVIQLGSATVFALPLQYGTTVYYRVTATDSFGAATAGAIQAFYSAFLNDPPQTPNIVSPFSRSPTVKTMKNSVEVSWQQVTDPEGDPITYTIYLGDSSDGMATIGTITQAAQGGTTALALRPAAVRPQAEVSIDSNTITLTLADLDYYKNYLFQVSAANQYGASTLSPLQTFTLTSADGFPKAYNYPNPFNPNRGGTNLVFNAPPSGYAQATVEVYSEWQALLFRQDFFNIPPGISQVHFDGRDRYGRAFFNGSYVCRVRFSGPDDKQIFYMLVVK